MNHNSKHSHSRIRRTVAAALIVAALVVFVGVFLVFQCLSFDENGAHVVDRYGILAMEQSANQPKKTAAGSGSGSAQPVKTSKKTSSKALRGAMLSATDLSDADTAEKLIQLAEAGKLNTVIVNIKDDEGKLNLPVETDAVTDVEDLQEKNAKKLAQTIKKLNKNGVHVVGRIYCFQDEAASKQNSDLSMQYQNGGRWSDYNGAHWLDPTNPDVVTYLCDIAQSAVDAGCDEILLDSFTFPLRGHIDRIAFMDEPESQSAALLAVMQEMQDTVGDKIGISLTASDASELVTQSETATEDGIKLGSVKKLLNTASRVYVPVGSGSAKSVIKSVQKTAPKAQVVPIFTRMTDWTEYTDDAVINAVNATDAAIAVFGGDKTAKSYDGSDQTTSRRSSSRYSEEDSDDEEETVSSSRSSRRSYDSDDDETVSSSRRSYDSDEEEDSSDSSSDSYDDSSYDSDEE